MSDANKKILDFIRDCGVFYYASVDDGKARVRPFGFVMVFEDKIYFGMGSHKQSYKQTVDNPYIEICSFKAGKFIRVRGKAVFDLRPEVNAAFEKLNPKLAESYNANGWVHANCYLEEMEAEIMDMAGSYEKII